MIIDTHCHLDDKSYFDDLDEVIKRAQKHDVKGFLIPGADIKDLPRAKEISYGYDNTFFAAGVHPYHANEYNEDILREYLKDERCIAVGECGLDYFRLPEDKEREKNLQKEIFKKQISLAKEYKKPLIIHIRDANDDSKQILLSESAKDVGGVLHCYNASPHLLELYNHGFYFGIGGVLTFKNAKNLVEILPSIPKERIIIETDAPYLTPHPYRGKRNEPYYTVFVVRKIAEILNMDEIDVAEMTTANAKRLFKAFASAN